MSLGALLFKCATLENDIEVMRTEILAQGGLVFGTHRFASKDALMRLIMKLHPKGSRLAAFSDTSSLFCHGKELNTSTDPHRMLRRLGVYSVLLTETISCHLGSDTPQKWRDHKVARGGGQIVCASVDSKVVGSQCVRR